MNGLPHIVMTGGLVDLPELRFTPSGAAVANFRLAGKKRVKDANGQWTDGDPIYMNVTVWRRLAENVAETLVRKGQRVTVEGSLAQQWWEKDGVKQSKFVIEADTVSVDLTFSSYTERESSSGSGGGGGGASRPAPANDTWAAPPQDDAPPF